MMCKYTIILAKSLDAPVPRVITFVSRVGVVLVVNIICTLAQSPFNCDK